MLLTFAGTPPQVVLAADGASIGAMTKKSEEQQRVARGVVLAGINNSQLCTT